MTITNRISRVESAVARKGFEEAMSLIQSCTKLVGDTIRSNISSNHLYVHLLYDISAEYNVRTGRGVPYRGDASLYRTGQKVLNRSQMAMGLHFRSIDYEYVWGFLRPLVEALQAALDKTDLDESKKSAMIASVEKTMDELVRKVKPPS